MTTACGWSEELAFAHKLAEIASGISLDYFGSSTSRIKSDGTPVSEADLAVDRALRELIHASYPGDAILSEELDPFGTSSRRWIIDPIDGTEFFLAGDDAWGNHIAFEVNDEVILGLVTRPVLSEVWWGLRSAGSWKGTVRNGQVVDCVRLRVSEIDQLPQSRVTVWPIEEHAELVARVKAQARWAEPSALCVLELLNGDFEAVCGYAGGPWDHAPAVVLVEEAGGRFCDPAGGRRLDLGGAIYTNGHIDSQLHDLIQGPDSRP